MNLLSYLALAFSAGSIVISCVALWLDRRAELNRVMFAYGLAYAAWSFFQSLVLGSNGGETSLFYYRISQYPLLLTFPLTNWLYLLFAGASPKVRAILMLPSLISFVAGTFSQAAGYYSYGGFVPGPYGPVPKLETRVHILGLLYPVLLLAGQIVPLAWVLWRMFRTTVQRIRRQTAILIISGIAYLTGGTVLAIVGTFTGLPPMIVFFGALSVGTSFYLIYRYRHANAPQSLLQRDLHKMIDDTVFILDTERRIVGRSAAAEQLAVAPKRGPDDMGALLADPVPLLHWWKSAQNRILAEQGLIVEMAGKKMLLELSARYDRFGDFVGAVAFAKQLSDGGQNQSPTLSKREDEIITLVVQGLSNQDIADKLYISLGTVKRHVQNIFDKTGIRKREQLFTLHRGGGL